MWSNKEISWLFQKVVLYCLCGSTKWSIGGVNQPEFIRHAFSSRYKITRAFHHKRVLPTQDLFKYPRFGSFKMALKSFPNNSWSHRNYYQLAKHFSEKFFKDITLLFSVNYFIFLHHRWFRRLWLKMGQY